MNRSDRAVGSGTEGDGAADVQGDTGVQEEDDRLDLAEDRTEWAERRTWWANFRTLLAKERTFSAWLRTGLATLVTGLAVLEFLAGAEARRPLWGTSLGVLLIVASAVIFAIAFWSYRKALNELAEEGIRGLPSWLLAGLSGLLILGSAIGLIMLL